MTSRSALGTVPFGWPVILAARIPWGVRFGGPDNCRFFKDLRLQPVPAGRGYRLDLADEDLLTLGLRAGA